MLAEVGDGVAGRVAEVALGEDQDGLAAFAGGSASRRARALMPQFQIEQAVQFLGQIAKRVSAVRSFRVGDTGCW
jgi:hypothetical protein